MRLTMMCVLLAALIGCSPSPPPVAPNDAHAPAPAEGDAASPPVAPSDSTSPSMSASASPQAGADAYLRGALDAAQQRYERAVSHCAQLPTADDCVGAATAALEQEQATARLEHQRQLEELHQGG